MKTKSGFTLIELLTTISIISGLALILIIHINNARIHAIDSGIKENVRVFSEAVTAYYLENGSSPHAGLPFSGGYYAAFVNDGADWPVGFFDNGFKQFLSAMPPIKLGGYNMDYQYYTTAPSSDPATAIFLIHTGKCVWPGGSELLVYLLNAKDVDNTSAGHLPWNNLMYMKVTGTVTNSCPPWAQIFVG